MIIRKFNQLWRKFFTFFRSKPRSYISFKFPFTIITIILLYFLAISSFLAALFVSDEWFGQTVSTKFVIKAILIPFFAIAISFGIQIIGMFIEAHIREDKYRFQSKFLGAIETAHEGPITRKVFLGYLLNEWEANITKLNDGIIAIHEDYWSMCAQLYDLALNYVECTSLVPLEAWDETNPSTCDPGLIEYKNLQKTKLIDDKHIKVNRTFILPSESFDTTGKKELFLKIACRHLEEGFGVYFIILDDYADDEDTYIKLAQDFSLIDNKILMLGRLSSMNQAVYYYNFYELISAPKNVKEFKPALSLFVNELEVLIGRKPILLIEGKRIRIDSFPGLDNVEFQPYKIAITSILRKQGIKC